MSISTEVWTLPALATLWTASRLHVLTLSEAKGKDRHDALKGLTWAE